MKTAIYESLDQLLAYVANEYQYHIHGRASFLGANGTAGCLQYVRNGASEYEQRPTLALLEKIDATAHDRRRREYVASPVGSFPNVAEFLQGLPMNMRRRQEQESEQSPIRVVVETLVSAGVKEEQIVRRGAAVAALVMRMNEIRPVELWVCWGMRIRHNDIIGRVKLDTTPISLSNIVAVLSTPQFCRGIMFAEARSKARETQSGIRWAWGTEPSGQYHVQQMREALELEPQDIYLPGGYLSEASLFMRDPVAWVNSYMDPQRDLENM